MPDLVWYAAYGSNMLRTRLLHYVLGDEGDDEHPSHAGCRDRSPPRADAVGEVIGAVAFAGRSRRWGGGTAVLRAGVPMSSPARLWLLTLDQLADVQAQECGLAPGEVELDADRLVATGAVDVVPSRRYGRTLWLGERDGHPIVSFTSPRRQPPAAPADAYVAVLGAALVELGWAPERVAEHLAGLDGLRGHRDRHEIRELVGRPNRFDAPRD